jgi:hypothetical protein
MYVYNSLLKSTLVSLFLFSAGLYAEEKAVQYKLAEKISSEALQSWNISVFPDGKNLLEGKGGSHRRKSSL